MRKRRNGIMTKESIKQKMELNIKRTLIKHKFKKYTSETIRKMVTTKFHNK